MTRSLSPLARLPVSRGFIVAAGAGVLCSVVLLAGGEVAGEGIEPTLRNVAASAQVPQDLVIVYDDFHPLEGGTIIEVRGDGTGRRTERSYGLAEPRVTTVTVRPDQLVALVRELVVLEAWNQKTPQRAARSGEGRAHLIIVIGANRGGFWEWVHEMTQNTRLSRIKGHLDRLVPPD